MRRAFVNVLIQAAESDPKVIFLTGDLGFQVFDTFVERFGPRYINVGIAEAEMIDMAAGLALEGYRPIAYSIASFITGRAFEQIRISVGYESLPVMFVGAGGGFCYASSGVTHHSPDDLGLMMLIPGITVVVPGDAKEVTALIPQLLKLPGPSYLRLGKFNEPTFEAKTPIKLGHPRLIRDGNHVAVLSVGEITPWLLPAMDALAERDIRPVLYHLHTAKPLPTESLHAWARQYRTWIVVEESLPQGGVAAQLAQWIVAEGLPVRIIRLGPPDAFVYGSPTREIVRHQFGYDGEGLIRACEIWWTKSFPPGATRRK